MFAQLLFSGLALGYNITYATSQTVNFSQGQSVMVGAVVAYTLYVGAGWPFPLALAATLVALAVLGVLVERIAVRPFLRSASIAWLLATITLGSLPGKFFSFAFAKDRPRFPPPLATTPWMSFGAAFTPTSCSCPWSASR